eukprot:gnl/MRDRNA2_/MRDRNA2_120415_c0_seq1.p1 gnl/MRDRNA2_/MRDRNA2_120415_c0~~gnl/MRDRNA2_/MRDRNA2_120415_c0_seq1.p1  ORF type:complete len:273 (-),score=46.16 gnl/MRDRNA2_/MRDRNA2_120415_c0_seq1:47-865(-)
MRKELMMRTVTAVCVINVHASGTDALARDLTKKQDFSDGLVTKVMGNLVDRMQNSTGRLIDNSKEMLLHKADLDSVTLGKPGHVLTPQMASPLTSSSSRASQLFTSQPRTIVHHARRHNVRMTRASALPESLQNIVGAFQMVPDPMQRYKQVLFFASKLPPMPLELKTQETKVMGCTSQVWVVPRMEEDLVYFSADSDSQLTKGLAALLVQGLSGLPPKDILTVEPDFIEELGLKQSLTPSRNNGFLNMLNHMKKSTVQLYMASQQAESAGD